MHTLQCQFQKFSKDNAPESPLWAGIKAPLPTDTHNPYSDPLFRFVSERNTPQRRMAALRQQ